MGKSKANKCSKCGQELDCLEDLILHEAMHDAGPEGEIDAEYVGGHIKFKNKMHTTLKLGNDKIDVMPFDSKEPSFSIPYKRIIAVDVLSSEQSSSFFAIGDNANMLAATAGISILTNYLVNKPKLFLALTFMDEYDIRQSVAFQMQFVEEAQHTIYDKVAQAQSQAQRLMRNTCRKCGESTPISMLRRNGGYCDFCTNG
jgi:hypothetical protein